MSEADRELANITTLARRYEAILEAANEGIYGLDREGRVTFVNAAAERLTGWRREEQLGKVQHDLVHYRHEDGRPYSQEDCPIYATLRSGTTHRGNALFWRKDGRALSVTFTCAPLRDDREGIAGAVVTFDDRSAELVERRYRALVAATSAYVWLCSANGTLQEIDREWLAMTGLTHTKALGEGWKAAIHPDDRDDYERGRARAIASGSTYDQDLRLRCADGSVRWFRHRLVPVRDGSGIIREWIGVGEDITEEKAREHELESRAARDKLTGLFNRREFDEILKEDIAKVRRHGTLLSLILFDVDHFKAINDRYGHDAGDAVLKTLVREVARVIRGGDILARWGGEEFAILLAGADAEGAEQVAESVRRHVAETRFPGAGRVTISVGLAQCAGDDSAKTLFRRADQALYRAKDRGRNRVVVGH